MKIRVCDLKEGDKVILPEMEIDGDKIPKQRVTYMGESMFLVHEEDRTEDDEDGLTEFYPEDFQELEWETWT